MNQFIQRQRELLGASTVQALRKNGFCAEYCPTVPEARQKVLEAIAPGSSVGIGGSLTVRALDLFDELLQRGCTLFNHSGVTDPAKVREICRGQLTSDVFLTGSNAITEKGELYNVDMRGNRVAAMIYGPRQVIVAASVNKVVRDLEAARERVRRTAAPLNCMRLNRATPCVKTGLCADCASPDRLCNAAVALHKRPSDTDYLVLLIGGEDLGF